MKRFVPALFAAAWFLASNTLGQPSQEPPKTADVGPGGFEMTTYYVGFLYRGPKWTPEKTPETEALQQAHLANIQKMAAEGKLLVAGPFLDGGDLRGIYIFRVATMEEAQALAATDPAVKAGRLRLEFHPWYAAKNITVTPHKESSPAGSAEEKPSAVTGWVSDEACGAQHTKGGGADCVRKCLRGGASVGHPEWKAQRMVFVADADGQIWIVDNPEALKGHEGEHVTLTGRMDAKAKTVRVAEARPIKEEAKPN